MSLPEQGSDSPLGAPGAAIRNEELPWGLVGAGPMGLVMARNLERFGLPFRGYEMHTDVGGLWDIDGPRSTMYESAHLISSKTMTELAEFPMDPQTPDYPGHRQVGRYFRDYADRFGLRDGYQFGVEVLSARRLGAEGDGFELVLKDRLRPDSEPRRERVRGLLVANGTLSEPNIPTFEGQFEGEWLHSSAYRHAELFEGKRVLVVGAGNSGCDIAVDAVHRAAKVFLSVRRGYHFVPKYVFGRPADTIGGKIRLPRAAKQRIDSFLLRWFGPDPSRLGWPKPDHRLYESHPIVNTLILYHLGHGDLEVKPDIVRFDGSTVHFRDGSREEIDLVLLATGYRLHYPFLDRSELPWKGSAPHLYLNCFHPERDDLFVLGMVEAAGLGWQGRFEQAELVARYLRGLEEGSSAALALRETKREPFPDMRGGWGYLPLDRMAYYVHKDTYRDAVRRHIRELGG